MRRLFPMLLLPLLIISCIHSPPRLAAQGWRDFEKQKYKKAALHFESAEQQGYTEDKMRIALGTCYLNLGRYDDAVRELSASAGDNSEAWFLLGNAYYNQDNYAKAAEAYRMTISIKSDYLEAIEALAMIYPDGGVTREEALQLWKRALTLEDRDEWITRAKHYIEELQKPQ